MLYIFFLSAKLVLSLELSISILKESLYLRTRKIGRKSEKRGGRYAV